MKNSLILSLVILSSAWGCRNTALFAVNILIGRMLMVVGYDLYCLNE